MCVQYVSQGFIVDRWYCHVLSCCESCHESCDAHVDDHDGQESRRDRNRRIDMGDDSAKLKIQGHGGHGGHAGHGHGGQSAWHSDDFGQLLRQLSYTSKYLELVYFNLSNLYLYLCLLFVQLQARPNAWNSGCVGDFKPCCQTPQRIQRTSERNKRRNKVEQEVEGAQVDISKTRDISTLVCQRHVSTLDSSRLDVRRLSDVP